MMSEIVHQPPNDQITSHEETTDYYWDASLVSDIEKLDSEKLYSRVYLSKAWKVHRNTISKWVSIAIKASTPGFNRAFDRVIKTVVCPQCSSILLLDDQKFLHLLRNWTVKCTSCGMRFKGVPKMEEVTDPSMKIPGDYAKVLRICGWLVSSYGIENTTKILSTSQETEHKVVRKAIRKLLLGVN